ncbi:hypothetical protein RvY_19201 [Ramazzottius varieornatus]|uniref:Uncharacterized protein n=1 Tax=Ramazzottius varieornatus TaxID=947166 RepID=A0A1D1WAQ4_RAMVA|nr:hypothetical protein RvY_19201 [Ramazzottius varieornatus]
MVMDTAAAITSRPMHTVMALTRDTVLATVIIPAITATPTAVMVMDRAMVSVTAQDMVTDRAMVTVMVRDITCTMENSFNDRYIVWPCLPLCKNLCQYPMLFYLSK